MSKANVEIINVSRSMATDEVTIRAVVMYTVDREQLTDALDNNDELSLAFLLKATAHVLKEKLLQHIRLFPGF